MFHFVVSHFHWLSRVPGLPQWFDTILLTGTLLFHRTRFNAMQSLEGKALRLPGVHARVHRYGGVEFVGKDGRELGHLHGHGLLDVVVGRRVAQLLIDQGRVRRHHVFPHSKWISFQIESDADIEFALELLKTRLTPSGGATSTRRTAAPCRRYCPWRDRLGTNLPHSRHA